jgi:23S rRNA pseudouridine2605 synthase
MDRERAELIEHVRGIQATVRSCAGCGLCCTSQYNSVRILPVEARRIAAAVRSRQPKRRADLIARTRAAIAEFRLAARPERQSYTCPYLDPDLTCALTFSEKPIACLSFNPVTTDHCEMDAKRFARAHAEVEKENRAVGRDKLRLPIPVAVVMILEEEPAAVRAPAPRAGRSHPLPRVLSKWHVASRQGAEALVRAGRVTVNQSVVRDVARMVNPDRDHIAVDGAPIAPPRDDAFVYVLLNKPRGYVTTTKDPEGRPTVMDLVAAHAAPGLAPVGRLDKDSAGVILFTNDHATAARLLEPGSHVAKTYRVKVKGHVTPETLDRMRSEAVLIDGQELQPLVVAVESVGPRSTWLRITIEEGKNRQLRRQCDAFGHEVEMIVRMTFGPLDLGSLKPGAARPLTSAEVSAIREAAR